ncbi:Pectate lyase superfamily protein [Chitinophaga sp. CF118]|uniref:glycosyl hydrolase family 28-related protein n=1 Tax=Chitinophaga sp. CF118 TaxID=1884367 RepID=UPI0008E5CC95|nr:glycosyl hydrolase family 28-related protein [Chitinophaga sp. CF118]SFD50068.1 Pectate lyase superfamily protein [Chitinophaga sp. CF118]
MKKLISYYRIVCLCFLLLLTTGVYSQTKLFQVTTAATNPGDAVLIRGEYLDKITKIQVSRLTDDNVDNILPAYVPLPREDAGPDYGGTDKKVAIPLENKSITVDGLQRNSQSIKFIVPISYQQGVYSVRLTDSDNHITGFYVNVPKVNWVISEEGLKVTAGSNLRIQGKNLLRKGATGQVVIISADKKHIIRAAVANAFDDFSVNVNIPGSTPSGNYDLYYHNGLGGKTAWSTPLQVVVVSPSTNKWDQKTFNVKDYGAKGDGVNDETGAFQKAIAAVKQQGGGTINVPAGRYMLTDALILPPFTMLKGASQELTQLFWNPANWATGKMPASLISGTHHFAIKDLNISATRAWGIIMQTGPTEEQSNVTLENLVVKQPAPTEASSFQVQANMMAAKVEMDSKWFKTGILLRGNNLKVRNCSFNCNGMYNFVAASGFIQHCRFEKSGSDKTFMAVHPKGLIFEDCYKQMNGYGYATSIDESNNLYEARNVIPFNYINDREVMTFDGGSGAYAGPVADVKGNTITLPSGAITNQWTPNKWIGGGVFILEGKGAGQYRRIVSHTLDVIQLDQPFLVDPDATSVISITTIRKNLFFIDNDVADGGAYQFYGSAENCVISGLKMRRCIGIIGRGSLIYKGRQPNWYIDIVNCELREGNNNVPKVAVKTKVSSYQNINIVGSGGIAMNIGTLVRRNKLFDFSYIRTSPGSNPNAITDVIIEDNSFTNADKAISLGGSSNMTSNVLIHNNHYKNVNKQVDFNTGLKPESYLILQDGLKP